MMTRRSRKDEVALIDAVENSIDRFHGRTRRQPCDIVRLRRNVGVGIEITSARSGDLSHQFDVAVIVNQTQILSAGGMWLNDFAVVEHASRTQTLFNRDQPVPIFRMLTSIVIAKSI